MQTIVFRLIRGIMLLPATADGQEGYFAFDTGAMQTAVNRAYFPELQGDIIEIAKFTEGVKKANAEEGMLTTLNVAGIAREQLPVLLMDLMYVEKELKTVDPEIRFLGTMGIDVIRDYTVLLDYEKQEIVLDPAQTDFAAQREVRLRLEKLPIIPVEIGGETMDFVLDTGASVCLLGERFRTMPGLTPVPDMPNVMMLPALTVAGKPYAQLMAVLSNIAPIQQKVPVEGVIGYQVLSPQRSLLDFRGQRLLLEIV